MTGSKWDGMPCLGFDVESSGTDVWNDRILTAALVNIQEGRRPVINTWMANPGVPIPPAATEVNKITDAMVQANGQDPAQVLFEVTGQLALALGHGIPVVAFNAAFDFSILEAENQRHGIDTLADRLGAGKIAPVIDPMVLANYAEPFRKRICACGCGAKDKTLNGWLLHYGVTHTGAHNAVSDTIAACRLWPRLMAKHSKKFPGMTLPALHLAQVGWRKKQADSLRSYFDRVGQEHDGVCGEWPLHVNCAPALRPAGVAS